MKIQFTEETANAVGPGGTYVPAIQGVLRQGINEVPDEIGRVLIRAGLVEEVKEPVPKTRGRKHRREFSEIGEVPLHERTQMEGED